MNDELKIDIGNNILIFRYGKLLSKEKETELREYIIKQLKSGVLVINKNIEVIVVKKEIEKNESYS